MESSEIFLPPNKLLVLRTHGRYHVVEIHDDVDKSVEQPKKCRVSTRCEANAKPNTHWHDTMVDNVQQGNMLIFLAKNEEKLNKFKSILVQKQESEYVIRHDARVSLILNNTVSKNSVNLEK